MSHDDIRALLQLQDDPAMSCDEVNALLDDQMRLVEQRIAELQALRKQLRAIRSTCAGGVCVGDCGALGIAAQRHWGKLANRSLSGASNNDIQLGANQRCGSNS